MAAAKNNFCNLTDRILELLRSEDVRETAGSLWGAAESEVLLQRLEKAISDLAPLLLDAEIKARHNKDLERWLDGVKFEGLVLDVEIELEKVASEALKKRSSSSSSGGGGATGNHMYKTPLCSFFSTTRSPSASTGKPSYDRLVGSTEWIKGCYVNVLTNEFGLENRSEKEIKFPNGVEETWSFIVGGGGGAFQRRWDIIDVDTKENIINMLLTNDDDDAHQQQHDVAAILPVLGTEESETRWLARDVFNDERVQSHFHIRIWVGLSSGMSPNNSNATQLLNQILVEHLLPHHPNIHQSDLDELLLVLSSSAPFLIVFDDVNPQNFPFLRGFLGNFRGKGSKIILTTSYPEVASIGGNIKPCYCLPSPCPFLSEDRLWRLFQNAAFGGVTKHEHISSSFIDIGKEIVNKCHGISDVVIPAIGSMLYFDNSEKEWRDFCYDEIEKSFKHNSSDYDKALSCLKLCYDHLPSRLKHCFAYCSLFPKDHEIDVQTIIKLWMAQSFVIKEELGKSAEDVGYEYVLNLLRRSFFQEPTIDVTERVAKFKIHHLMHDLATLVAEGSCFSFAPNATKPSYQFHVSFDSSNFSEGDVLGLYGYRVRSVLLQNHSRGKSGVRRGNNTNTLCDKIIKEYDYLRSLDMCGFGIKIVPNSIGDLEFLKYLDLSENEDIIRLPNSITKLVNLQTLRLSSCVKLRELPRGIQKLVSLRHLEIDGCLSLTSLPQGFCMLTNLRTLRLSSCFNLTKLPRDIPNLISLRHLEIDGSHSLPPGFGRLTNLQTLSHFMLRENSSTHDPQLIELKKLSNLRGKIHIKNLSHEKLEDAYLNAVSAGVRSLLLEWNSDQLKMNGYKPPPLDSSEFSSQLKELVINGYKGDVLFSSSFLVEKLCNLVKLSLRRCAFCQYLPSLDELVYLNVLVLDEMINLEYISENDASLSTTTKFFPHLQELWLTELPQLKGWWKNGYNNGGLATFPCLSKLVIEDCPKLDSMPLFPTLEEGLIVDATHLKPFSLTMSHSNQSSSSFAPLSKLKNMCIVGMKELGDSEARQIKWGALKSLQFLRLDYLPLTTLPIGLGVMIKLQELNVWRCAITNIDEIEALKLLEKLVIRVCPQLKSLPQGIGRLENLTTLEIDDCPTLLKRCEKEIGADWEKIAHIPKIRLGQIDGR